jgi:hypothetical protein
MSSEEEHREAMKEYLGFEDYREVFKTIKEDLYSRVSEI